MSFRSDDDKDRGTRIIRKVDPAALPSRKEVHQTKRKRRSGKGKFVLIKLLVILFILLPIGFFVVYTYLENRPNPASTNEVVGNVEQPLKNIDDWIPYWKHNF